MSKYAQWKVLLDPLISHPAGTFQRSDMSAWEGVKCNRSTNRQHSRWLMCLALIPGFVMTREGGINDEQVQLVQVSVGWQGCLVRGS